MKEISSNEQKGEIKSFQVKDKVDLIFPGIVLPEGNMVDLAGRTPEEIAQSVSENVYAFRLLKVAEATMMVNGREVELRSEPFELSGWYYIDGQIYTIPQLEKHFSSEKILIDNCRTTGAAVFCRTGNWQPFDKEDQVISSKKSSKS